MEFDEEFRCPVCQDLMVQAVILPCGHSFCNSCLATSVLVSKDRTCPTCQQPWQGFPTPNFALRNTITKKHREYLADRESTLKNPDKIRTMKSFKEVLEAAERLDEDFRCPLCRDLMVQPVILSPCGHNLCNLCLARNTLFSRTKTCPKCRRQWLESPKPNLALRNMITRKHREYLVARESAHNLPGNVQTVMWLKTELEAAEKENKYYDKRRHVLTVIAHTIFTVLVLYSIYRWIVMNTDPVTYKPVMTWHPGDVSYWLDTLTWAHDYTSLVYLHQIDGPMLMGTDEMDLLHLMDVTDVMHQHAMQVAIRTIRENGVKMPENLWDYITVYPGRSYILAHFLIAFPRASILLMYIFYYQEMFVPFVQTTTPVEWGDVLKWDKAADLKTSQTILFGLWTLLLPYWKIVVFAWAYRWQHYIFLVLVLTCCVRRSYDEVTVFREVFLRKNVGRFRQMCTEDLSLPKSNLWIVLWPVLPQFIRNINLYFFLLVSLSLLTYYTPQGMEAFFFNAFIELWNTFK